jgi:hypothetical protein
MFYCRAVDEDLIRLRKSLAMAPSLPRNEAERLLDEVELLRRRRRDLGAELDALAEQVRRLRSSLEFGWPAGRFSG